ncbi:MAG: 4-(cytidine 5'-diphospho)-2-C-methyl-D-erythritol kinase [Oscillospiraceae bacterium]
MEFFMNSITVSAPAKINLMLDVTGKRSDGFHTLLTVMQSISLPDTVYISANGSDKITVECNVPDIPCDSRNIAYKAAAKFYEYFGISGGVHIKIEKNIPSEAGLGGGSADGAAVLLGMNKLYNAGFSLDELCKIGVTIGADVPFCIKGGTKLCRGIGEEFYDIEPLEDCYIVIGKGKGGISTQEAFRRIDSIGFGNDILSIGYDGTAKSVSKIGKNIFEAVADIDDVKMIKELILSCGAVYSAMSGSGTAVFGLFSDLNSAQKCADILKSNDYFSSLCKPISHGVIEI